MKKSGSVVLILILIPTLYLILGFYFNDIIGLFSLRNVDPEYIYLTNGLYMSLGHLNVPHIDNPGTPLQVLVAIVCKLVYLFRSHEIPYIEDVLANSDLYLNMVNHVVISLVSVMLFVTGMIITRITSFTLYGLLAQTAPFFSSLTYDIVGRLTPELLLPIPVLLLMIIILKVAKSDEKRFDFKTILIFGIISGFGLSIKLSYFPLLIIPFLIITNLKDKLKFIGLAVISLFVFAAPILFDLVFFFTWIKNLFIHSGSYGSGETNIIEWQIFFNNLNHFYKFHKFPIALYLGSVVILFAYQLIKRKGYNKRVLYGQAGVLVAMIFQLLLVAKHYKYSYLVPGLSLLPLMLILSFEMLQSLIRFNRLKLIIGVIILAGFAFCIPKHITSIRIRSTGISNQIHNKMLTKHFVEAIEKDAIKLLAPTGYGCPFHDFSMMISKSWAGRANQDFLPVYKKLYPNTYQYYSWEKRSKYWETYKIENITESDKPVYFYIDQYTPEKYTTALTAILPEYNLDLIKKEMVFKNDLTGEIIFRLHF